MFPSSAEPEQAYLADRGDHPFRLPDVHHRAVHCLPLLLGAGHTHSSYGGHRGGCPEWCPDQRRQASGDGTQGKPCQVLCGNLDNSFYL